MNTRRSDFETMWRRFDDIELSGERTEVCGYARGLLDWAAQALDVSQDASVVTVNQAKVLLLDKYFDYFSIAPKRHRYHFGSKGHICISHIFRRLYWRLKETELSLTPPMLFLPPLPPPPLPPPPPPAPVQIAGIPFGEVIDDGE